MQTSTIASFTYDGDGRQVKAVVGSTTTYYVGAHYQVDNGVVTKYYFAGAQRVAMRKNGTLYYLLADHLGSTSLTTDTSGAPVSELRYKAWGETRYSSGTTPTSYKYTGQREEPGIGLYFYNTRWYDPLIGRFTSADTIVPSGVQGLDRYAYVNNSPINYIDPSGHDPWWCKDTNCQAKYIQSIRRDPITLSKRAGQLIGFAESVGMSPEEVIGIGLGHEMFGEDKEEQAFHMQAYRNGFLRYVNVHCNGNPTYNCMLNYFADSYESVYNQFLSKESGYTERTNFWGHRDRYLSAQYVRIGPDGQLFSNLSENYQAIVKSGIEFMGNFMDTISSYSYNPELALNSGVVDALTLNKALGGYPTSERGFMVVKRVTCPNTGAAGYSLIYNLRGEKALDAAGLNAC